MRGKGRDFLVRQAAGDKLHGGMHPRSALVGLQGYHEVVMRPSGYRGYALLASVRAMACGAFAGEISAVVRVSLDLEKLRVDAVFFRRGGRFRRRAVRAGPGRDAQPCQQVRPVVLALHAREAHARARNQRARPGKEPVERGPGPDQAAAAGRLHGGRVAIVSERSGRAAENIVQMRADPVPGPRADLVAALALLEERPAPLLVGAPCIERRKKRQQGRSKQPGCGPTRPQFSCEGYRPSRHRPAIRTPGGRTPGRTARTGCRDRSKPPVPERRKTLPRR